ncbi:MAG: YHYH protein [Pseudomonadota bacterium]
MSTFDFRALAIDVTGGQGALGLASPANALQISERVALRLTTQSDGIFGGTGGNFLNTLVIDDLRDLTNDMSIGIIDSGFVTLTLVMAGQVITGTYLYLSTEKLTTSGGANGYLVDVENTGALDTLTAGADLADLLVGAVAAPSADYGFFDLLQFDEIETWRERGAISDGITTEDARSVAYLYGAAFDRAPDFAGLNYWIDQYERGLSLNEIAGYFVGSAEFETLYGASAILSNAAFLEQVYNNTLKRVSDQAGFDFWLGHLDDGLSRAELVAYFSASEEYRSLNLTILGLDESSLGVWHIVEISADVPIPVASGSLITMEPQEDYAYQTAIDDGTITTNVAYADYLTGIGNGTVSWNDSTRFVTGNSLPEYQTDGGSNPFNPSAQAISYEIPLIPDPSGSATYYNVPFTAGVAVNSVVFRPFAAEWFDDDRNSGWQEDPFITLADLDFSNAHTQPDGTYHYHGVPEGLIDDVPTTVHSPIVGWAADGFPIYSHHLYADPFNPNSDIIVFDSSWELKSGNRPDGPGGTYDGTYVEDYVYNAALSTLDELNGRWAVTPEFPNGTYYYVVTDAFPYIPRGLIGTIDQSFVETFGM